MVSEEARMYVGLPRTRGDRPNAISNGEVIFEVAPYTRG